MVILLSGFWLRSIKRRASILFSSWCKKLTIKCVYNTHLIRHLHISWVLQSTQEKLKTILIQNCGGQTRCILGDVKVANALRLSNANFKTTKIPISIKYY